MKAGTANGKKTFFDDVMVESKKRLPPNKYAKHDDWNKMSMSVQLHGHVKKDLFSKKPRETLNDEVIKRAKANKIPAPGAYNIPVEKLNGVPKSSSP